jgi:hypothetical protein
LSPLLKPTPVDIVGATIAVATMTAAATTVDSISDAPNTMDANIIGKMAAAYTATRVTAVKRFLRSGDQRRPQIGG